MAKRTDPGTATSRKLTGTGTGTGTGTAPGSSTGKGASKVTGKVLGNRGPGGRGPGGEAPGGRGSNGKASNGRDRTDKAAAKQAKAGQRAARKARFGQVRQAFTLTRQADSRLVPLLLLAFLVPFVLLTALGLLIGGFLLAPFILFGVLLGLLAAVAVFGRRAQRNAYRSVEGTPGAAASVIESMRGDWRVTPAVGFTAQQDLLHRVVGRPGVILVREGVPSRTKNLIVAEKKKLARFVGDTPVYEVSVGTGDGAMTLQQLERHLAKLPRNIKPKDVNILDRKLKAMAPALPIPKGPMPQGGRVPRGKMR